VAPSALVSLIACRPCVIRCTFIIWGRNLLFVYDSKLAILLLQYCKARVFIRPTETSGHVDLICTSYRFALRLPTSVCLISEKHNITVALRLFCLFSKLFRAYFTPQTLFKCCCIVPYFMKNKCFPALKTAVNFCTAILMQYKDPVVSYRSVLSRSTSVTPTKSLAECECSPDHAAGPFMKILQHLLYEQTNELHFLYVFILQFFNNSTCFERTFRSSSGVNKFTVSAALYKPCKRV
jgi:hypothetical protein